MHSTNSKSVLSAKRNEFPTFSALVQISNSDFRSFSKNSPCQQNAIIQVKLQTCACSVLELVPSFLNVLNLNDYLGLYIIRIRVCVCECAVKP